MVHDNAVALLEPPHAGAALDDLAGRLMPGYFILVSFRPFAEVFAVNGPDVASANRGRFCFDENLAVPRFGNVDFLDDDRAVAG
jgi:hypothetical protein